MHVTYISYSGNDDKIIIGRSFAFQSNVYQWNIVFYVSAVIFFLGNLIFIICGKGEVQWWNNPDEVQARRQKRDGDIEDKRQT